MSLIQITCPSCRAVLRFPSTTEPGKTGRCPKCKAVIPLTPEADARTIDIPMPQRDSGTASGVVGASSAHEPTNVGESSPATVNHNRFPFLAPPQSPDEIGRLGPYRILSLLGEGGMGAVFRAEDPALRRQIALKVMLPDVANDDTSKARFLREARAAAALTHDHVIPVHQVGEDRGVAFIAMPLLQGETLSARIKRGRLSIPDIVRIAREIASGLDAAHEHGLIHRDIKPANIWLEDMRTPAMRNRGEMRERVKILDFGLARAAISEAGEPLTREGTIMGTPAYMSPEQARSAETVDGRTDLFSLGVVMYQMLTGVLPFKGKTMIEILTSLIADTPATPRTFDPGIPIPLELLTLKLMAKDAARRPQSASDVVHALESIQAQLSGSVSRTVVEVPAPDPWESIDEEESSNPTPGTIAPFEPPLAPSDSPRAKRKGWLIGVIGVLALVLGGFIIIKVMNKDGLVAESTASNETGTEVVKAGKTVTKVEPPKKPALLSGDLTKAEIDGLRKAWADYYGVKLEYSEDLGNDVKLEMVFIPPGTFWMGSPESEEKRFGNETQHEVTISEGFYIGKYEVTQEQYEALMGTNPSWFRKGGDGAAKVNNLDTKRFPVETVKWQDAQDFLIKLAERSETNKAKRMYRLPREAEWEYICRGGQFSQNSLPFHFESGPQKTLSSTEANFEGKFPYVGAAEGPDLDRTSKVGDYQPNRFGVYDMHGNVWEWCEDWYDEKYYATSPMKDPKGPATGVYRVLRGGGWNDFGRDCRASLRGRIDPTNRFQYIGFRVLAPSSRKNK